MVFENACFIKPDVALNISYTGKNYAPEFRKKFNLEQTGNAKLYVCGLGCGYYYINGKAVSGDLFTAPVSNYEKTLWYNVYDVSELLKKGENIIYVICGNSWYNEEFASAWDYNKAPWRDVPKFILSLEINGKTVLSSDESWKCLPCGATYFNALRSGEYFDSRLYDEDVKAFDYNDESWKNAAADKNPPKGSFRECLCEPVREFEIYDAKEVYKAGENKFVFDLGQNISGYIRLKTRKKSGDELIIRYAEQIKEDLSRQLNDMDSYYSETEFQTDRFICCGKDFIWSPKFTYHGFRYIEIEGLNSPDEAEVQGVFVHQAVKSKTKFRCSDEILNRLFELGKFSTLSNLFYMPTDCPTREKLGWANDAQSSAEQMLTNFGVEKVFEKWLCDIYDAMNEDGALPGIIPTSGWGYHWGNGPVSDGVLFEIPYRIYLHTGNEEPLKNSLPYFERYLKYLETKKNAEGFVEFGLDDWANPNFRKAIPTSFINSCLIYNFYNIASLAADLSGGDGEKYRFEAEKLKNLIMKSFLNEDGTCTVNEQTAAAMLIYYDIYKDFGALKNQLRALVEKHNFHHTCGMVGLRRLYIALNKCGLSEYAYKIIRAEGFPSYKSWLDNGATTLWETWNIEKCNDSKNHHMYSDFMSWIIKTIIGLSPDLKYPGFEKIEIKPCFLKDINFAECEIQTAGGALKVYWERSAGGINLKITVFEGAQVFYKGKKLEIGENNFFENI